MRTNFANALAKLAGSFEEMFLVSAWALVPAPTENARQEVELQTAPSRVASSRSGLDKKANASRRSVMNTARARHSATARQCPWPADCADGHMTNKKASKNPFLNRKADKISRNINRPRFNLSFGRVAVANIFQELADCRPDRFSPCGGRSARSAGFTSANFAPVEISPMRPPFMPNQAAMSCWRSPLASMPLTRAEFLDQGGCRSARLFLSGHGTVPSSG